MEHNDELFEEDLEFIRGGMPREVADDINLIANSKMPVEKKKKLLNEILHKILTGKIVPKNNSSNKRR